MVYDIYYNAKVYSKCSSQSISTFLVLSLVSCTFTWLPRPLFCKHFTLQLSWFLFSQMTVVLLAVAAVMVSAQQEQSAKRDKRGFLAAPAVAAYAAPYAALPAAPLAYAHAPLAYAASPYVAAPAVAAPYAYYG